MLNLVIMDDSLTAVQQSMLFLEKSEIGAKIFTCQDLRGLMDIVDNNAIDIIIMDIIMPEMNGMDILKMLKDTDSYQNIDVMVFAALSDMDTLNRCFELGAIDCIGKPINEAEFVARVRSAIRRKKLEKDHDQHIKEMQAQNDVLIALNNKLLDTQNQLLQQEKMASVGHLAAGVAHEINNPLGFITSNMGTLKNYTDRFRHLVDLAINLAEAVQEDKLNETAHLCLHELKAGVRECDFQYLCEDVDELLGGTIEGLTRMRRIVTGLRNFSRMDPAEGKYLYNLNEGVESTLTISRNEIKYVAEVVLELGPVPEVFAYGGQINQVIMNILLNAAAAIKNRHEPGRGRIHLKTWRDSESVNLMIADSGTGITEENISHIFDPFFTTKPVGEGTGLGLSISYDIIVNKHQGKLVAKSVLGIGTEFHVSLPISLEQTIGADDAAD